MDRAGAVEEAGAALKAEDGCLACGRVTSPDALLVKRRRCISALYSAARIPARRDGFLAGDTPHPAQSPARHVRASLPPAWELLLPALCPPGARVSANGSSYSNRDGDHCGARR